MSSSADANTTTNNNNIAKCAACGKEDGDGLKACTACKLVKYCNASCQRAHWQKHKGECKKRAAELHDKALFKPPTREECPICCLPLPLNYDERKYQPCCGKILCYGCIHAAYRADSRELCPFCRTIEAASWEEANERLKKRAEGGDAKAIHNLGCLYKHGQMGFPQDLGKAMELWHRAGELGCADANCNIGYAYEHGEGVDRDLKKAKHLYELAAMGGDVIARHNLGAFEGNAGNMDRAMKHWMISAGSGFDDSLTNIKKSFMNGHATKDDFEKALRAHKEANDDMKSDQRDAGAAALAGAVVGGVIGRSNFHCRRHE